MAYRFRDSCSWKLVALIESESDLFIEDGGRGPSGKGPWFDSRNYSSNFPEAASSGRLGTLTAGYYRKIGGYEWDSKDEKKHNQIMPLTMFRQRNPLLWTWFRNQEPKKVHYSLSQMVSKAKFEPDDARRLVELLSQSEEPEDLRHHREQIHGPEWKPRQTYAARLRNLLLQNPLPLAAVRKWFREWLWGEMSGFVALYEAVEGRHNAGDLRRAGDYAVGEWLERNALLRQELTSGSDGSQVQFVHIRLFINIIPATSDQRRKNTLMLDFRADLNNRVKEMERTSERKKSFKAREKSTRNRIEILTQSGFPAHVAREIAFDRVTEEYAIDRITKSRAPGMPLEPEGPKDPMVKIDLHNLRGNIEPDEAMWLIRNRHHRRLTHEVLAERRTVKWARWLIDERNFGTRPDLVERVLDGGNVDLLSTLHRITSVSTVGAFSESSAQPEESKPSPPKSGKSPRKFRFGKSR
jgi:hypothetical protein